MKAKFFSIDVETGGYDPQGRSLLEVGIVADGGGDIRGPLQGPGWGLPSLRCLVLGQTLTMDIGAAGLHGRLLDDMKHAQSIGDYGSFRGMECVGPGAWHAGDGSFVFAGDAERCRCAIDWFAAVHAKGWGLPDGASVLAAGKNAGGFDLPWLRQKLGIKTRFKARVLDPGPLYMTADDTEPPDLPACMERAGMRPTGLHTAVGDALDVCRLLRHAYGRLHAGERVVGAAPPAFLPPNVAWVGEGAGDGQGETDGH
jgi:hypothetical protein